MDWRVFGFTALVGRYGGGHCRPGAGAARRARHGLPSRRAGQRAGNEGPGRPACARVAARSRSRWCCCSAACCSCAVSATSSTQDLGVRRARRGDRQRLFPDRPGFRRRSALLAYARSRRPVARHAGSDRARGDLHDADGRQLLRYATSEIDGKNNGNANRNVVSAGYFKMLGTPILAGRDFDARDMPGSTMVAIVTKSFAQRYLKGAGDGDWAAAIADHQRRERAGHGLRSDRRRRRTRSTWTSASRSQRFCSRRQRRLPISGSDPPLRGAFDRHGRSGDCRDRGDTLAAFDPTSDGPLSRCSTRKWAKRMLQERLMARLSAIFGGVALSAGGGRPLRRGLVLGRQPARGDRRARRARRQRGPAFSSMILGDVGRIMVDRGVRRQRAGAGARGGASDRCCSGSSPTMWRRW